MPDMIKKNMENLREKDPLLFEDHQKNRDEEQYKKALQAVQRIASILKQEFRTTEVRVFEETMNNLINGGRHLPIFRRGSNQKRKDAYPGSG